MQVIGCAAGVDIAWDRWGIPHIRAASVEDVFFGQGFAAASARLWQMDLGRRRGLGLLAEAFGPAFLPWDVAARTMLSVTTTVNWNESATEGIPTSSPVCEFNVNPAGKPPLLIDHI